jgi:hypothetical protein
MEFRVWHTFQHIRIDVLNPFLRDIDRFIPNPFYLCHIEYNRLITLELM